MLHILKKDSSRLSFLKNFYNRKKKIAPVFVCEPELVAGY
jgi:hypothetical protein